MTFGERGVVATDRRELIVYATPIGPLADQCAEYFARIAERPGPTTAQAFPPHVTLTGFFHRRPARADRVIAEMSRQIDDAAPPPPGGVEVAGLVTDEEWVGLGIESPWLGDLTRVLIEGHDLEDGDDSLRPKRRLHLSLAYGDLAAARSLGVHAALARELVDPTAAVQWEVAVWERRPAGTSAAAWTRHGGR